MKISVVIVHWNTPHILIRQLRLLKPSSQMEIIVVDNNSDRPPLLKSPYRMITCTENRGFAAGCNSGAAQSSGEWILFLNPDTHITTPELLRFVRDAQKRDLDAASPSQTSANYFKPLPSPFNLLLEFSPLHRYIRLPRQTRHTLFGGCLLIKRSVLRSLNGWDEDFFLWFEDSDLTCRLYEKNFRVGWVPVRYTHNGGSSFARLDEKKRKRLFFASMNTYARKHFSLLGRLIVRLLTFTNRAV